MEKNIDLEWDVPIIEIHNNLVWIGKENEQILSIKKLSPTLVAIYSHESDYSLSIMSKTVFYERYIPTDLQALLIDISFGDFNLNTSKILSDNSNYTDIIDTMIANNYLFIVEKSSHNNVETIKIVTTIDWNSLESLSVEYTEKGRISFANHTLAIELKKECF